MPSILRGYFVSFAIIISTTTLVVWFFPLFKQYKTEYFYYFSVHALSGPAMLFVLRVFNINPNYLFITCYLLLLSAIADKKYRRYLIPPAIIIYPVSIYLRLSREWVFSISALIDLLILLALLDILSKSFIRSRQINFLPILLVVYTLIDFSKLVDGAISIEQGMVSFYLGLIVQMFFCAAFCFINVNTKNFKLRIKEMEDV